LARQAKVAEGKWPKPWQLVLNIVANLPHCAWDDGQRPKELRLKAGLKLWAWHIFWSVQAETDDGAMTMMGGMRKTWQMGGKIVAEECEKLQDGRIKKSHLFCKCKRELN